MSVINLKCCLEEGRDDKIFVLYPYKVAILRFAIETLLVNQGYLALSGNFDLYVNDPKENKLMESAEEISKYFDKPFSCSGSNSHSRKT